MDAHNSAIRWVAWAPDGQRFVTAGGLDRAVVIWAQREGEEGKWVEVSGVERLTVRTGRSREAEVEVGAKCVGCDEPTCRLDLDCDVA